MIIFLGRFPTVAATETEDLVCVRPNMRHAIHLHGGLLMARVLFWTSVILCLGVSHLGFVVLRLEPAALSVTPGSVPPSFSSCCREIMLMCFHTCLFLDLFPQRPLKKTTIYYVWKKQVLTVKYPSGCHDRSKIMNTWEFQDPLYQSRKFSKHLVYIQDFSTEWFMLPPCIKSNIANNT